MTCSTPLIVALDVASKDAALTLLQRLDPTLCRIKIGKELFTHLGPGIVEKVHQQGFEVFLDLKFHDIPHTTAMAVSAAADLGVWMVNVHCSGGLVMLEACSEVLAQRGGVKPLLIGVTVLTSMSTEDLTAMGCAMSMPQYVDFLASLAAQAGLDGVVCSAQEASLLKIHYPNLIKVTPGIRPRFSALDDQHRVLEPAQALAAGADYLVIGRPITRASDPLVALKAVLAECAVA